MVTAVLTASPGTISKKRRQNKLNQLESCSSFTVLSRNWVQATQKNESDKSPPACHLPPLHCSCRGSSCAEDADLSGWPQDTRTPSTANMHTIFFKLMPYVKFLPTKYRALMLQHCLLVHKDCCESIFLPWRVDQSSPCVALGPECHQYCSFSNWMWHQAHYWSLHLK